MIKNYTYKLLKTKIKNSKNRKHKTNIYIDDKLIETIDKKPDSMIEHKTISLNYANHLKIGITGNRVTYGFGNIKLKY